MSLRAWSVNLSTHTWASLLGSLPVLSVHSYASNWQLPFLNQRKVGWLCWGLTSQSTIFQSCRDGAIASWVSNQYFRGVKCLAQGHNTAAVGLEPRTSRSEVRHSTTEPPRSPNQRKGKNSRSNYFMANLKERMLSDVRIEPATVSIPGGRASDWANAPASKS